MESNDESYLVGFGKPPKHTQFKKGKSGNPHGRTKGSVNPATILAKICRERIVAKIDGKTRSVTKFEATMLQLVTKGLNGDLRAIRELWCWLTSLPQFEQAHVPPPAFSESDALAMDSIVARIRCSEPFQSVDNKYSSVNPISGASA